VSGHGLDRLLVDGDLDGLLRLVDEACDDCAWDDLEQVALRARKAHDRGYQLWPAADHAEHRLALEAPADRAAAAVLRDAPTFGLAPLAEVVASTHRWVDLEPHLPIDAGPVRSVVAHERVARGEDLTGTDLAEDPLGLPLNLAPWEPRLEGPTIGAYSVEDPVPAPGPTRAVDAVDAALPAGLDGDPGLAALGDLTAVWAEQSNGLRRAAAVRGTAAQAVASLSGRPGRHHRLPVDEALGLLAWAGASGGAHGRRRGMARGRFEAWWCAAALTGLDEAWPPDGEDLGGAVAELRWWRWDDGTPPTGWHLLIAVEDPADGLAWALDARDAADRTS